MFSFISGGRIPHLSIVLLFLSIYTCVVSYKKKKTIKSLTPNWCILCMGSGETIDYFFLYCLITLGLCDI